MATWLYTLGQNIKRAGAYERRFSLCLVRHEANSTQAAFCFYISSLEFAMI